MKFFLTLVVFASIPTMAASCYDTAMTQASISDCAQLEHQDRDNNLNSSYKALMKKFVANKEFKEKLKKAQRAWISYRDLELDLIDQGGSSSSMCRDNRLVQLNKERADYLKSLLEKEEGDVCAP
jgi:uncharacterized protein YecT (DUF1311 family)